MKNRQILLRVLSYARPHLAYLLLALALALVSVGFSLYVPVLTGQGVDLIVGEGMVDFICLIPILIKLAISVGISALAQWLLGLCTNRVSYLTVRDIRIRAMEVVSDLPLSTIDSTPHGDILSRITTDIDLISEGLLTGFTQAFTGIVTILGTLFFMLELNPGISLVVVLVTPLSLFVASFIAKRSFAYFREQSELRGEMSSMAEEMVTGQRVVKAFNREDACEAAFGEINEKLRVCGIRALFFSSITNPATRFVNGLVYAGVGVFGALAVMGGGLSVGQLSAFLSYANQYTKPFNEISGVLAELQSAIASAGRVFDIIDQPVQSPDPAGATVLTQVDGSVRVEILSFSYRKETPLLRDLNLRVEPGQRIAIVGPTGCGKTTIINLLMRFYDPDEGRILVSGRDVQQVTRDSLRSMYGMVLQETWLKNGTVFENIAYGKPDARLEEVTAAAKAAHAHSFIQRLPDGYDTLLSEDGGNLSQGQKQLLCIARVMLCLPPMLILDEATSSIDTRTELHIQNAFAELMRGRTSFIVAHRLSTIREADCILVMNKGRVVEMGSHDELIKADGFYKKLYMSQFGA